MIDQRERSVSTSEGDVWNAANSSVLAGFLSTSVPHYSRCPTYEDNAMIGVLDDVIYEVHENEHSISASSLLIGPTQVESESNGKEEPRTFVTTVSGTTEHGGFEWHVTTEQLYGPPIITDVGVISVPSGV
jgi:hypothetical protein